MKTSKKMRRLLAMLAVVTMLMGLLPFGGVVSADEETTESVNLALNKSVEVSGLYSAGTNFGAYAVDGNINTRWGGTGGGKQDNWIEVDLGAVVSLGRVVISWETAYSSKYEIYVSDDDNWGEDEDPVATVTYNGSNGNNGVYLSETYLPKGITGRYLKVQGVTAATQWGMSIWELEVYAPDTDHPDIPMGYAGVAIDSLDELKAMRDTVNAHANASGGMCYFLTNDITISGNWEPIGTNNTDKSFAGVFDGNGHTITFNAVTMAPSGDWNSAFFYSIKDNAVICNLTTAGSVTSGKQSAAVLVGEMLNGTIKNCVNNASLENTRDTGMGGFAGRVQKGTLKNLTNNGAICTATDRQNVGGIVGRITNSGATIEGCTNTGAVKGSYAAGGIVGRVEYNVLITNCVNKGAVSGYQKTGGIVGESSAWFTIRNSTNQGTVTTSSNFVGGVVGMMSDGMIVNSVNFGTVTTNNNWAGGLVGAIHSTDEIPEDEAEAGLVQILIANSANCGDVKSTWLAGGISAGLANSDASTDQQTNAYSFRIENCYNAGAVKATAATGGTALSNNNDPIVARQSLIGVSTASVHCYALENSAPYVDESVQEYDAATMMSQDFVEILNANIQKGLSYRNELNGEAIPVPVTRWRYTEGNYPTLSTGIIVKATGKYGENLFTVEASSAEELAETMANAKAPALGGYAFVGWNESTDADAFAMVYDTPSQILALTPVYQKDEDAKDYTITITDATAVDGQDAEVLSGAKLSFDTRVELTGATEGQTPSYWVVNGAKVSFKSDTCTVYIGGDMEVTAVYDSNETVGPSVVLQNATSSTDGEKYNLSVIAQTSIPDDATVKSYGVYYTASASALTALKNKTATEGTYVRVQSQKTAANLQYMTHLLSVAPGKTRYAMAYAVLEDDTVIFSSDVVQFKTTADGVDIVKGAIQE